MKRIRTQLVTMLFPAVIGLPAGLAAQTRPPASLPEAAEAPQSEPDADAQFEPNRWGRPVLRIGQNYTLRAGDGVRDVVVIGGDAAIEGRVDRDVVVVLGKARLSSTAHIDGSLVVVGGSATAEEGAFVGEDLAIVGGGFDAPVGFAPGGQQILIGPTALGGRVEAVVPWITRGLLWGRPIVPDLPWVWRIVGVFFLVYLVLNLMLHGPVGDCAEMLVRKPLSALGVGLLVLLLTGPVCLLLAVSVVGIIVIPFVICALFAACLVGRIGVARWIGMSVTGHTSHESRPQGLRSFVIGAGVICIAYIVPVLGFVAWTMVGVFGLGAATLAFIAAYREENPPAVPRVVPTAPAAPAPAYEYVAGTPSGSEVPAAAPSTAPIVPPSGLALLSFPRAAFFDRAAAFVLDVILVLIAAELLDLNRRDSAVFLLLLGYHIGFWTWKGTTVGGIICQLRIIRVDGTPPRFVDALVRGLSSIFSLAVLGLGCLWIVRDPERQAWHDKIAGTYVVKVPRNWPI
jgi:uncharacterized RDD family membrane protein YckC